MSESAAGTGWKTTSLTALADYHNGVAFKPDDWGTEGLPIVRIEQLNDPSAPTDCYDGPILANNVIDDGDLVFSWSATLKVAFWRNGPAALNQHLFKVVPHADVDLRFLKHVLDAHMDRIAATSQGSTMKHVTRKDLDRYHVAIPTDIENQRHIAEILSTVDEAIEQTEALIAKTREIKAGLMHDLFTRGVTPDGRLRPPREEAPELYKESPLGWIPRAWEVTALGAIAEIVSGITLGQAAPRNAVTVPYLRVANVQDGFLDLDDIATIEVDPLRLPKLLLRQGDILMNEGGDFDKLGRGTVWNGEIEPCIHQNHVFRVRIRDGGPAPHFVAYWSQSEFGKRYFVISSKQSTNLASINSTQLNTFPVFRPPSTEMWSILEVLLSTDSRLKHFKHEWGKNARLKAGLMSRLLNGKAELVDDWGMPIHGEWS